MKTRIVILSAFLTPFRSGAEACAEEVAARLSGKYDITIVTARGRRTLPKHDLFKGKVVIRRIGPGIGLGLDKWLFPFLAPFVVRRLRRASTSLGTGASTRSPTGLGAARHDVMIIHAVLETFAGLALHFCRRIVPDAKRILTLQTTNRSFLKGMIIRSPHVVTAISSALVAIAKRYGRNDVALIPNGIDCKNIEMRISKCEKVPGRVLFAGRLEQWKGIDTLLQAFSRLTAHCSPLIAHLRIVGGGSQRAPLESLARKLGIADRVTFTGFVPIPDVYAEFAQAEIFCALSRSEALGNVFLEAQAAGCAVIGTNVGGIPDIVADGVTGLLVPPDDAGAAADALRGLLYEAETRRRLAAAGREQAEKYDWDPIARQYAAVYDAKR